jgi:hypothetical protein
MRTAKTNVSISLLLTTIVTGLVLICCNSHSPFKPDGQQEEQGRKGRFGGKKYKNNTHGKVTLKKLTT